MRYQTIVNGQTFDIEIVEDGRVLVNGEERAIDFRTLREGELYSILLDHRSYEAVVEVRDEHHYVLITGGMYEAKVTDERSRRLESAFMAFGDADSEAQIRSPMPGLIVRVLAEEGQEVTRGQTVVILESMKMENELKSPRDGVVRHVHVEAGQSVEQGKTLVTIA